MKGQTFFSRHQGDIASLKGEDVDWTASTVSFTRKKTGVPVIVHLGKDALNILKDLPADGVPASGHVRTLALALTLRALSGSRKGNGLVDSGRQSRRQRATEAPSII